MKYEIKNWHTNGVLFSIETDSWRIAVEKALARGANLSGADLSGADLSWANLSGANLYGANLSGANLSGADLSWANLSGANLSWANLYGANLSGANLSGANLSWANLSGANLSRTDLSGANLSGANLSWANLYGANLSGANLCGADLSWANLSGANLYGANLSVANLYGAKGVRREFMMPLLMLLDQPGKMRAYKLVTATGNGPWNGGHYEIGKRYKVGDANTDNSMQCGPGLNVATLDWVLKEWREGYRVLIVEFTAKDIACIPTCTDGKFRLHRFKVVGEKDISKLVSKEVA